MPETDVILTIDPAGGGFRTWAADPAEESEGAHAGG